MLFLVCSDVYVMCLSFLLVGGLSGWIGGEWNAVLVFNLLHCVLCDCFHYYMLAISMVTAVHAPTSYVACPTLVYGIGE